MKFSSSLVIKFLIFAWHCVMLDGKIKENEITVFNELCIACGVSDERKGIIQNKAKLFANLDNCYSIQEYFK